MQLQAITHTPLSRDAYLERGRLVIRIRTAKGDMKNVWLYYGDRVCPREPMDVAGLRMEKVASDLLHDYYECVIISGYTRICYYFFLEGRDGEEIYYSEYGFHGQSRVERARYFQFPYLRREDEVRVPDWTKSMVMYHIFPDSFADGPKHISGRPKQRMLKNGNVSRSHNSGTLSGVRDNLDYLNQLGINCIYLNPVFEAASYHKYDTIDYRKIDPCFGTLEDLKDLVADCHRLGIRVILDGVFNHCGSGFFAFQDVLKNGEASPYKDWFYELHFPVRYQDPPNYESFAYVKEMPKLNTGNPEVEEYFCEIGRYWIREADIDGWRLDVANEVNHGFWRKFKEAVRAEKPEAFLIGEIWEDSGAWLLGDQFDSTMNYSFSYLCREFFAEDSIGLVEFDQKINHMNMRYQKETALAQMNFLDTHDVPRFLSYCGGEESRFRLAFFFLMTAMGIPSVFYGDEQKIMGMTEPEYRSPMPWSAEKRENETLMEYMAKWIRVRRQEPALGRGSYRTKLVDESKGLYGFVRKDGKDEVTVILNKGEKVQEIRLDVSENARWTELGSGQQGKGQTVLCPPMQGIVLKIRDAKTCIS